MRDLAASRYFQALARAADIIDGDVNLVRIETARPALRARIAETSVVLHHG